jgi:hypothetical protein
MNIELFYLYSDLQTLGAKQKCGKEGSIRPFAAWCANGGEGPFASIDTKGGLQTFAVPRTKFSYADFADLGSMFGKFRFSEPFNKRFLWVEAIAARKFSFFGFLACGGLCVCQCEGDGYCKQSCQQYWAKQKVHNHR